MVTIHENINEFLAADLHGELSESEREELHTHLMECAECRSLHKGEQLTHKLLQATVERAKPPLGFEQRMVSSFRNRVPKRNRRLSGFFVNALRWRAVQAVGVAALFFVLVQMGRVLSGDADLNFAQTPLAFLARMQTDLGNREKDVSKESSAERVVTNDRKSLTSGLPAEASARADTAKNKSDHFAVGSEGRNLPRPGTATSDGGGQVASYATGGERESDSATGLASNQPATGAPAEEERVTVTGSNIPFAEEFSAKSPAAPAPNATTNSRKLVRNAKVDLEVKSFDEALQSISSLASEGRGYVATTSSEKQENGKLRGQIVVKVLPENLDDFLAKLRNLGDLTKQTLAAEDVTKQYVDTDARLRNARLVEQRLVALLDKNAGRVSDLLQVEKELGRVREQVEQLQGELKAMDMQVQFATVTISLAEKDMETPAGFLLKERVQLSLFAPDVEKIYAEIKGLASPSVQITNATLDRDDAGRKSARVSMLIAPENADGVIAKVKSLGRVENYQLQSERVARGGEGMSREAKTERDKVQLNITIWQDDQEAARQQTSLRIRASDVTEQSRLLREVAEKQGGRVSSSSFSRDPNGREYANVALRVPMQNYAALMQSLSALGKLENLSVRRDDRPNSQIDEKGAPADISIQVYSQGNMVAEGSGLPATLRRTVEQGASALMWSVRMIGVALAFLAPWIIALAAAIGIVRGVRRSRRHREN
jgi:Domain of unknown function (DUF4349)/Putative zinc-finger